MKKQEIIEITQDYEKLTAYLKALNIKKLFLVCDSSLSLLKVSVWLDKMVEMSGIRLVRFSDFNPNPVYESVSKGVALYRESLSDAIMAIGGGSAMDVAKCIKLYANMDDKKKYLNQEIIPNEIPLLVMPTTAGTGSEATRYAVIYYNGMKQSITHESCIPDIVFWDSSAIMTLPMYQKKSTMLDALCHAVESFWSVNSNDESKGYSRKAIELILKNKDYYLLGEEGACAGMLEAAYIAGKAINITQTTAGHAMCYKLTSLYNTAHGHSAALCLRKLWPYMLEHVEDCIDARGESYLKGVFNDVAASFGCDSAEAGSQEFVKLLKELELSIPKREAGDLDILVSSVNPVRLKNNPVKLSEESIRELYIEILD